MNARPAIAWRRLVATFGRPENLAVFRIAVAAALLLAPDLYDAPRWATRCRSSRRGSWSPWSSSSPGSGSSARRDPRGSPGDNLRNQLYWKWTQAGSFSPAFRVDRLPWLCRLGALLVVAFELGFGLLLPWRTLRPFAVACAWLFHLATAALMNVSFFSLALCYVMFFDWRGPLASLRARLGARLDRAWISVLPEDAGRFATWEWQDEYVTDATPIDATRSLYDSRRLERAMTETLSWPPPRRQRDARPLTTSAPPRSHPGCAGAGGSRS